MSKRASRQIPVVQMTEMDVAAAIVQWDAARSALDAAGTAAQQAQVAFDALPPDATEEAKALAQDALSKAQAAVAAAQKTIQELKPLPEEAAAALLAKRDQPQSEIPAGSQSASAAGQSGAVAPAQQNAQGPGGETANDALSETGAVASAPEPSTNETEAELTGSGISDGPKVRMAPEEIVGVVDREITEVLGQARQMAAVGDIDLALAHLEDERANAVLMMAMAQKVDGALSAEIARFKSLVVTAPVESPIRVVAKVPTRWRIGRQFTKEHTDFEVGELAADELEALKADPLLIVTVAD